MWERIDLWCWADEGEVLPHQWHVIETTKEPDTTTTVIFTVCLNCGISKYVKAYGR